MSTTARAKGFTLTEMLVAISIFAALSIAGSALLSSVMTSRETLRESDDWMRQLEVARSLLKADLIQAIPRPMRGPNGQSLETVFTAGTLAPSDPFLLLTRRGWENLALAESRGTLQMVSYRLEDGVLVRSSFVRDTPAPFTELLDRPLMDGLESVDVRVLQSNQWVRQLNLRSTDRQRMPQAVEVVLNFGSRGLVTWLFQTPGARQ